MRGDRVGQPAALVDPGHRGQDLGRDLLVELDVLVELREQRAAHRLDLVRCAGIGDERRRLGREVLAFVDDAHDARALRALDQHLDRAVGELQHLQHRGHAADRVEVVGARVVLGGRLLRDEQDLLARVHRDVERLDRLRTPDEQRDDHVGEDDDVPQRQQGQRRHVNGRAVVRGHWSLRRGVRTAKWGRRPAVSRRPRTNNGKGRVANGLATSRRPRGAAWLNCAPTRPSAYRRTSAAACRRWRSSPRRRPRARGCCAKAGRT